MADPDLDPGVVELTRTTFWSAQRRAALGIKLYFFATARQKSTNFEVADANRGKKLANFDQKISIPSTEFLLSVGKGRTFRGDNFLPDNFPSSGTSPGSATSLIEVHNR